VLDVLECADCHTRVRDDGDPAQRCPRCGGRLLAPPGPFGRRRVLLAFGGAIALLLTPLLVAAVAVAVGQLRRGPDLEAQRERRLWGILREAEQTVPSYPGGVPLHERAGQTPLGTAPALDVCWQAPATLDQVLAFYRRALPGAPGGGWRLRGTAPSSALLGAERGQVRLLVHGPASGAVVGLVCPAGTTYVVSLTVFRLPPGQRGAAGG
jgi:DNA-directed RNA polymerase subunit RPC12/RpoP